MKPGAGQHPESSDREVLAGLVERVTFHNLENGFCVLRTKARGHRDLVTVVGHAAMVGPGEWITASGEWVNDRTHGQQFKARFMRTSEPSSDAQPAPNASARQARPICIINSAGERRLNTQSINDLMKCWSRVIMVCGPIEY